jgi:hypothetical protein
LDWEGTTDADMANMEGEAMRTLLDLEPIPACSCTMCMVCSLVESTPLDEVELTEFNWNTTNSYTDHELDDFSWEPVYPEDDPQSEKGLKRKREDE